MRLSLLSPLRGLSGAPEKSGALGCSLVSLVVNPALLFVDLLPDIRTETRTLLTNMLESEHERMMLNECMLFIVRIILLNRLEYK